ncbi:MAG: hypothetical protein QM808_07815 [Steroidobacteraceae bacterium]
MSKKFAIATLYIISLICVFSSPSTAQVLQGFKPSEFQPVSDTKSYDIKSVLSAQKISETGKELGPLQGILPGKFVSMLENSEGTLYFGSGRPYFIKYAKVNTYYVRPGGFWIPKAAGESPKLFFIVDSNITTAKTLDAVMSNRLSEWREGGAGVILNAIFDSSNKKLDGRIILATAEVDLVEKLSAELNAQDAQAKNEQPIQ